MITRTVRFASRAPYNRHGVCHVRAAERSYETEAEDWTIFDMSITVKGIRLGPGVDALATERTTERRTRSRWETLALGHKRQTRRASR